MPSSGRAGTGLRFCGTGTDQATQSPSRGNPEVPEKSSPKQRGQRTPCLAQERGEGPPRDCISRGPDQRVECKVPVAYAAAKFFKHLCLILAASGARGMRES